MEIALTYVYGIGRTSAQKILDDKKYFYELNDRFLVRKVTEMEKSEMESIVKKYLEDCNIIWNDSDFCTVICSPEKVESAVGALVLRDDVLRVTHKYMEIASYEDELTKGVGYPTESGWNGQLSIRFKNEIHVCPVKIPGRF